MSIVRTVLRLLTRKAIEGRTMAGALVKDSSIVSLEDALSKAPEPVVLIYTDDSRDTPKGKDLWGNAPTIDLVLVVAVAGAYRVKVKDGEGETTEFAFPPTDASTELMIDVIEREIKLALVDPANPWAELWKKVVLSVDQWNSIRGASTKEGQRFAARQITIRIAALDEPEPGGPARGAWAAILDRLEAEDDLGRTPTLLRALIEGTPRTPEERAAISEGWSQETVRAMAIQRVRHLDFPDAPGLSKVPWEFVPFGEKES